MATIAERNTATLNDYETEHGSGGNIWDEVINHLPLDQAATEAEDPSGRSTVAVFADGSIVRYLEDQRRWVAEG